MEIESRVCGIPCQLRVDSCVIQKPQGRRASSDWDCAGYEDIEFTVLDRRGREAPWLQNKMTDDDIEKAESEILQKIRENKSDY